MFEHRLILRQADCILGNPDGPCFFAFLPDRYSSRHVFGDRARFTAQAETRALDPLSFVGAIAK